MSRLARERHTPTRSTVRRDELIDRIVELLLRDGFAELSLDELARVLRCSKSTLYTVAASKEQIIVTAVRRFFRSAASRVEARLRSTDPESVDRIGAYLMAISAELAPASATFFADLDAFAATREIYQDNTRVAAQRLQELVLDVLPEASRADAIFVGTVAAQIMEAIHRGEIEAATGLDDSAAYRALAKLVTAGVANTAAPAGSLREPQGTVESQGTVAEGLEATTPELTPAII